MILEFSIFKPFRDQLIYGVTTKPLGSFDNREKGFEDQIRKLNISDPVFSNQVHGDTIIIVNQLPDTPFEGDSFITDKKRIPLAVKVADCQGILIFDPKTNSIASIHSGWRGSALNIIGKTINKMVEIFKSNPSDLLIGISPSLGPCCAEFSDPKNELPKSVHPFIQGKNVDLWSLSHHQLTESGVPERQIEIIKECTKCNSDKYFSHRNKDGGRMAVLISLK